MFRLKISNITSILEAAVKIIILELQPQLGLMKHLNIKSTKNTINILQKLTFFYFVVFI